MRMTLYDYCAERDELVLLTQWAPVKNRTLTPREGSYGRRQKNWRTYWPERWPPSGAPPDLTPEHVTAGSRRMAWRECPNGHIWKAAIYSRAGPQKCVCSRLRRESPPGEAGTLPADAGRNGNKTGRSANSRPEQQIETGEKRDEKADIDNLISGLYVRKPNSNGICGWRRSCIFHFYAGDAGHQN